MSVDREQHGGQRFRRIGGIPTCIQNALLQGGNVHDFCEWVDTFDKDLPTTIDVFRFWMQLVELGLCTRENGRQ